MKLFRQSDFLHLLEEIGDDVVSHFLSLIHALVRIGIVAQTVLDDVGKEKVLELERLSQLAHSLLGVQHA